MSLANEIVEFFQMSLEGKKQIPKSIDDFGQRDPSMDVLELHRICSMLTKEQILHFMGHKSGLPGMISEQYACFNYNNYHAEYGIYDFLANGFPAIRKHFEKSVIPIIVKHSDGTHDIGTGFLFGKQSTILTAGHNVTNKKEIIIQNSEGNRATINKIYIPENIKIDLAIICIEPETFREVPAFMYEDGQVLDQVLTMGYPPIPGFDALQVSEICNIGAIMKLSIGEIIGKDKSYLDQINYFLVNAKVKGGNSGSPVINKRGHIVGIIVQIPIDIQDQTQLDKLGYGVAVSIEIIIEFIQNIVDNEKVTTLKLNGIGDNRFSTI
jgi:serine protease Do